MRNCDELHPSSFFFQSDHLNQKLRAMKRRFLPLIFLPNLIAGELDLAPETSQDMLDLHAADRWELAIESGYTWGIGSNTPLDYEIIPTQLSIRTPTHLTWFESDSGARLVVRGRYALLLESFVQGPESYYVGISGAPSIEYWFAGGETAAFFCIGGGLGITDSTGVAGGQGQDFTLNWFSQLGIRHQLANELSVICSAYFLHHSNGGQTNPNPGIDSLGFTLGFGYQF